MATRTDYILVITQRLATVCRSFQGRSAALIHTPVIALGIRGHVNPIPLTWLKRAILKGATGVRILRNVKVKIAPSVTTSAQGLEIPPLTTICTDNRSKRNIRALVADRYIGNPTGAV